MARFRFVLDLAIDGRRARVTDVGGLLDIRASGGDGLTTAEMIAIHDRFTEREYVNDLGRRQRLFTGSAREAAKLVMRHCEHPGCELPADWCEVDHIVEWGDHGVTDQRNSALECDGHNRAKHRRRWRTRRRTDGRLVTHRADGTMMLPVGVRPPTFPPDDEIEHGAGHSLDDIARLTALVRQRVLALRSA